MGASGGLLGIGGRGAFAGGRRLLDPETTGSGVGQRPGERLVGDGGRLGERRQIYLGHRLNKCVMRDIFGFFWVGGGMYTEETTFQKGEPCQRKFPDSSGGRLDVWMIKSPQTSDKE